MVRHSYIRRFPADIAPLDPHAEGRCAARRHRPICLPVRAAPSVRSKPAVSPQRPDPYVLVLLADQELRADRYFQAKCLIEAAYAAYDGDM